MARFCHSCGAALPDGVRFCPSCGTPVIGTVQQTPPPQTYQQPVYQQPAYQQPVYQNPSYQPDPRASAPAALPLRGAPGGSKVMIIFYLITVSIVQILNLIGMISFRSSSWSAYLLGCTVTFTVAVVFMIGVFIKRAPWLYGIGLTLLSAVSFITAVRVIFSGSTRELTVMNVFYVFLYSLPLLLAALHYYLGGRGFKGGLKNAMMIIAFVYSVFSTVFNMVEYIRFIGRYNTSAMVLNGFYYFLSFLASLFLFIATLIFTVRRKA